jgi:hypothetical protein
LLTLFVFVSVSVRWTSEVALPGWLHAVGGAFVLGGTLLAARRDGVARRVVERLASASVWNAWWLPYPVGGAAFLLAAGVAHVVLESMPHVPDEFAYLFQARLFADGHLYAPVPPLPEHFPGPWVLAHEGRLFAVFPPGWSAVLAVGALLGVPQLVNPLLAAGCVVATYFVALELFDRRTAALSALLLVASPFFVVLGASLMSHMAVVLSVTTAVWCLVRATVRPPSASSLGLTLLASGLAVLVRPVDGAAVVGTVAALIWLRPTPGSRRPPMAVAAAAAGVGAGALLLAAYFRVLTGVWFVAPMTILSPANRMGFGADVGLMWDTFATPGHTPWRALLNLNFNMVVLSQDLFGWPLSGLLPILVLLLCGRLRWGHVLCAVPCLSLVVAYAFYWYHGVAYGARFYSAALPFLVVLTAEGLRQLPGLFAGHAPRLRAAVYAAVVAATAFGWFVYVPRVTLIEPYPDYRGIHSGLQRFVEQHHVRRGVVFVRARREFHYGPGFLANRVPIRSGHVIYALDLGPAANARLLAFFPDRQVYYYEHGSRPTRFERLRAHLADRWR